jgi:hypothetical protein
MEVKRLRPQQLASIYLTAKEHVINAGFASEIDWQASIAFDEWNETEFLRESAWVVLSFGFREVIVRRKFPEVSASFLHWIDAHSIIARQESCREQALLAFRNARKIDAIITIVGRVAADGIHAIREGIRASGAEFIQQLPMMGPTTARHLAKNLGLPVVKPDRHLIRFAESVGYSSAEIACDIISQIVGDPLPVVDLVLWRHSVLIAEGNKARLSRNDPRGPTYKDGQGLLIRHDT